MQAYFTSELQPPPRNESCKLQTRLVTINKMALDAGPEVEALMSDSDDELPIGWEMRSTDDGKVYYVE